jgi:hypothetical protein
MKTKSDKKPFKSLFCVYPKCKTIPIYNLPTQKYGSHCKKHKEPEMIDVKNTTCIYKECKTRANYNYRKTGKGLYCLKHKLENMINVVYKLCICCDKIPHFNYHYELSGIYCGSHKLKGMINVKKTYIKDNEYYKEDYVDEKAEKDNNKLYVKSNTLQILLKYKKSEDIDKIVNNVEKIKELDYMFEKVENYEEEAKIAKMIIDIL